MAPTHASEAVFRPRFHTRLGSFDAGRAFALRLDGRDLLVTCQHLFGPASRFFDRALTSGEVASQLHGLSLRPASGDEPSPAKVTSMLLDDGASADDPKKDACVFVLDEPADVALTVADREPEPGDRAFLASPLRAAKPGDPVLHAGRVLDHRDGLLTVQLEGDDPLWGCSGAPIVDEQGDVLGVLVRFRDGERLLAVALDVPTLRSRLGHGVPTPLPAGTPASLPDRILDAVAWSLGRGKTYEEPESVDREIADFYSEYLPERKDTWRPHEIVLEHPEICIWFSAHAATPPHEEQDGSIVLHAQGDAFTALDLVFQMTNAVAARLKDEDWDLFDHCFFEGLHRCAVHVGGGSIMPAYSIAFGS